MRTSATYNVIGKNCTNLDIFGNSELPYKKLIQNIFLKITLFGQEKNKKGIDVDAINRH